MKSMLLQKPWQLSAAEAEAIYAQVWRLDFSVPGFYLLDLGLEIDSHSLRSLLVALKDDSTAKLAVHSGGRYDARVPGRLSRRAA